PVPPLRIRPPEQPILWIGWWQLVEFSDECEIWIHYFHTRGQGIFQRHEILKLPRVQSVGDEQLIAQFQRRIRSTNARRVGQILYDTLDSESAIYAVDINFGR